MRRLHRNEPGDRESWRCRQKYEVARFECDGALSIYRKPATPFQDRTKTRRPERRVANTPPTGAADAF